jgi:hypothetical protein
VATHPRRATTPLDKRRETKAETLRRAATEARIEQLDHQNASRIAEALGVSPSRIIPTIEELTVEQLHKDSSLKRVLARRHRQWKRTRDSYVEKFHRRNTDASHGVDQKTLLWAIASKNPERAKMYHA